MDNLLDSKCEGAVVQKNNKFVEIFFVTENFGTTFQNEQKLGIF